MQQKLTISISADITEFQENKMFNEDYLRRTIGEFSSQYWMSLFYKRNKDKFNILTSDIALKKINSGILNPKETLLIQHSNDRNSDLLKYKGCIPFYIYCMESPLFAGKFYDNINYYIKNFKNIEIFEGLNYLIKKKENQNISNYIFPSYDLNEVLKFKKKNKYLCIVTRNKFLNLRALNEIRNFDDFISYLKKVKDLFLFQTNYSKKVNLKKIFLHYKKYQILNNFIIEDNIEIGGANWDFKHNIPQEFRKNFINFHKYFKVKKGEKTNFINKYKYCLCIENVQLDGYITEKILDSMKAMTIPIYYGALNIEKYIPSKCFINFNNFQNFEELSKYLRNLKQTEYENYINNINSFFKNDKSSFSNLNYVIKLENKINKFFKYDFLK